MGITQQVILDYLKAKAWVNKSALEQKLGIPQSTLSKAVKGAMPLPKKWVAPLANELGLINYFKNKKHG